MKKIFVGFSIFLIFILTGCTGPTTYDEISLDELSQKVSKNEDFILLIGSDTCSACQAFTPTINKIIKEYKLDVKYININKLSDNQKMNLQNMFSFSGTPTLLFVKNGEEEDKYSRIVGNQRYSKVVKRLKEKKYIKE